MSNVYELNQCPEPIKEASVWIAKLDRELTVEEQHALQSWFEADSENMMALLEVARIWDRMDTLSRLADLFPQTLNHKKPYRMAYSVAATLLLAAILTIWTFTYLGGASQDKQVYANGNTENIYWTEIGEQSTVILPDGTTLILNTNSMVTVTFSDQERMLELEQGEVYVQVAHEPSRPFSVQAGEKVIEAIGTEFNVKITQDQQIELIVTEGRVLVGLIDKSAFIPEKIDKLSSEPSTASVPVEAGEKLLSGESDEQVDSIEPEEIDVKLSWRGGNIIFHGESLSNALQEIERYTHVQFVILDDELKEIRVAGLFKAGDVNGLLATLRENFNILYEKVNDSKIILTKQ